MTTVYKDGFKEASDKLTELLKKLPENNTGKADAERIISDLGSMPERDKEDI